MEEFMEDFIIPLPYPNFSLDRQDHYIYINSEHRVDGFVILVRFYGRHGRVFGYSNKYFYFFFH